MTRSATRWVGLALLIATAGARAEETPTGQWIWSEADRAVFAEARATHPTLRAGVFVSTLTFLQGQVQQRLAFSPAVVGDGAPVAIVIRLDDSLHAAWRGPEEDDPALAAALGARLSAVLALASRSAVPIAEVQLDYDCPVRHLRRWAGVLRALVEGPLRGRELWLTSLVAHARQPGYGDLFRGLVAGHVVQVFDTGDRAEGDAAAALLRALEAQRMPFRLGVGAFERVGTAHAAWFDAVPAISRSPWYRGLWIFPGGQRWLPLLGSP